MHQPLIIASTQVQQDAQGRYCLNDLHRASGGQKRHGPNYWLENQQTKELVDALAQELSDTGIPVSVVKGGMDQGTYVCKELVYAYAMWISAKFHLQVIRAYDAMVAPAPAFTLPDFTSPAAAARAWADAMETSQALALERDHAIKTKAQIGEKKVATAMATASHLKRENNKLKSLMGEATENASIVAVQNKTGRRGFNWRDLKNYCTAAGLPMGKSFNPGLQLEVNTYPAGAWFEVYGVDLVELFGEVAA